MKQALIFGIFIVLGGAGIYAGVTGAHALSSQTRDTMTCKATGQNHTVLFADTSVQPRKLEAKRCDTMTIISGSNKDRLIAFGVHNQHVAYNGVTEKRLPTKESFTITLDKAGSYLFHDHDEEALGATFDVVD